jgi:hypothetical protein
MRRLRERGVHIAIGHRRVCRDVVCEIAMDARSVGLRGRTAVAGSRQDIEIDRHGRGGVLGEIAGLRDHHRDGLPDIADLVVR